MAGSINTCCIAKCNKTRTGGTKLHLFPHPEKDKDRFITWVNAVGSDITSLDPHYIYVNRVICSDHFEDRYKTWTGRLSNVAVPTLLMPGFQVVPNIVLRDITNVDAPEQQKNKTATASTSTGPAEMYPGALQIDTTPRNEKSEMTSTISDKITEEKSIPVLSSGKQESEILKKGKVVQSFIDDRAALAHMLKKATKKNEKLSVRLKKALKLTENRTFQKIMNKFTSFAAIFISMQFREIGKNKMARRYTQDEKIMSLSLYKYGPKLYKFMSKKFALPSPLTLSRLIVRANLRAGINEKLFNVLKKKVKMMKSDDKLCILLFDEVAISPHFDYNSRKDEISGFVTDGITKEKIIADHALVFMIRGVLRNYKQPVAYTFCSGSTKKEQLAVLLEGMIKKLHSVGLRVLATVCDQGTSNVSCINHLINKTKVKYLKENKEFKRAIFEIDDQEVIPLYDPPHLLKGIRNNLLNKDLQFTTEGTTKTAKWEHLVQLHNENPTYKNVRLLNKLTDEHINPEKNKMKVKYATQVFSQKVGATMGYLADKKIIHQECNQTAELLLFFDQLFDSVNGSFDNSKKRAKALLDAVKPNSLHSNVWAEAKKVFSTMKFVKNGKSINIPSVHNWLHTINNVEYMRDMLFNKYKIKSFWMRHFNQDPLENFFGCIRSHGCRNVNPTPEGFECAYASLLISNLSGTHAPGYNCEEDTCTSMFNSMKELFTENVQKNTPPQDIDINYLFSNVFVDFDEKKKSAQIYGQIQYITGYLLRKINNNIFHNCVSCRKDFYTSQQLDYLSAREQNKKKTSLHYPKEELMKTFSKMQDLIVWVMKNHSNEKNLRNYIKTILYVEIELNFNLCKEHKKQNIEYLFDFATKFFIYNWCKDINKLLRRRNLLRKEEYYDDVMKKLAVEYCNKHRK